MIECVEGLPGAGKSYYMAYRATQALKRGKQVFANFQMEGVRTFKMGREGFFLWEKDLSLVEGGKFVPSVMWFPPKALVLIDEAQVFFNSRNWAQFGEEFIEFFSQTRKDSLTVLWASQSLSSVDKIIRQRTMMTHKPRQWWGWLFDGSATPHPLYFWVKSYHECKEKYKKNDELYFQGKLIPFKWDIANRFNTHEKFGKKVETLKVQQAYEELKKREEENARKAANAI